MEYITIMATTQTSDTHHEVRMAARELARKGLHGRPGDSLPNLMSGDAVAFINANLGVFESMVSTERIIARCKGAIRETRSEMRAKGIKRTSCFNGGLLGEVYSLNARMFQLETELKTAESKLPKDSIDNNR